MSALSNDARSGSPLKLTGVARTAGVNEPFILCLTSGETYPFNVAGP